MARMYLIVGLLVVACTVAVWAQPRIAATGSMWLESCTGDWIPSVPVKTLPAPPDYFHLEGPGGAILKLSSPELTAAFTVGGALSDNFFLALTHGLAEGIEMVTTNGSRVVRISQPSLVMCDWRPAGGRP